MDFELYCLSDELIFVRWYRKPTPSSENAYLQEITALLNSARTRLFFLSDLSSGYITHMDTLCRLADLSRHKNWGCAVSYGQKMAAGVYVDTIRQITGTLNTDTLVYSIEDALDHLEVMRPGITALIDREVLELLYG